MARTSKKRASQPLNEEQLREKLNRTAEELSVNLAGVSPEQGKELLGGFVSELYLALAKYGQREDRRQKQAAGIAAAKASGVRFGRPAKSIPENFDKLHRAWRGGEMTLAQAAEACGIPSGTFYNLAVRREQSAV